MWAHRLGRVEAQQLLATSGNNFAAINSRLHCVLLDFVEPDFIESGFGEFTLLD